MNTTYTLTEGNDALNRVLLMMRYDLGKTLNENVVLEQMPEPGDFENNPSYGGKNVNTAKIPSTGYYTIKATTLSEGILKMREFFYSPIGATTQVVLSIVGVEIGLPLVFTILDGVIIVNDAYIMVRDWNPNGPKVTTKVGPMGDIHTEGLWEWFQFHFNSNKGFQYLCEDILAVSVGLGVMGLGKVVVKSAKNIFKLLIKVFGKDFQKKIVDFLTKFRPDTNGLPKEVVSWVDKKMSEVDKAIEIWKTPKKVVKSVTKKPKLVLAGVSGLGTYKLVKWFESKSEVITKFFESNPEKDSVLVNVNLLFPTPKDKDLIDGIREDNPILFPKNFKINSFKMKVKKMDNKPPVCEYVLINNVKYAPVDTSKSMKLKKIK